MAKTKKQKKDIIKNLEDKVKESKSAVFVNFSNIPVKEIDELRNKCRDEGSEYMVAKKTLLKKVLADSGYEEAKDKKLEGEVAAVFGQDEVAPAKCVKDFAKDHETMNILGGLLEGKMIEEEQVKALATMPSKDELIAKVVGSIAAPLSGVVNALHGNLRNLVYVLNAVKEKKS